MQQLVLDGVLQEELVCVEGRAAYARLHVGSNWPLQEVSFTNSEEQWYFFIKLFSPLGSA